MAAMGANQFNSVKDQEAFINWYVIISYGSTVTGATIVVYTEDNVSWALGFGLSAVANIVGLAVFFLGSHYYHQIKLQGSPFTNLARVIIAAIRKRKVPLSSKIEDYYCGHKAVQIEVLAPTKSLRYLNHAALKIEGETRSDGSIAKPWSLCSTQKVEDLKTFLRIFRCCQVPFS
ncbi:putative protein NRT1/ PTR FAMILY 2.2 [Hevea brasiliensis]|uniref:putative protein NRT1/ PTR FAMILY 2.2 n=1 Tax=Hevea brasiliensis TaxID=3981 RepID=UPI0025DB5355|nr:putative protein NRT1/ PTR FAMILY 2.2 [Hevea brasiliensis]